MVQREGLERVWTPVSSDGDIFLRAVLISMAFIEADNGCNRVFVLYWGL
jgi:hypothetical protein